MNKKSPLTMNRWTLLFSLLFGIGIFGGVLFFMWILQPYKDQTVSTPVLTVIIQPTDSMGTPEGNNPMDETEITETLVVVDGISLGAVVQITGTEGAGLRLRQDPGVSGPVQFIGDELELFEVNDGPVETDGYLWWYLESPYDTTRSGWAASMYLSVIEGP